MKRTIGIIIGIMGFVLLFNAGRIRKLLQSAETETESYTSLIDDENWNATGEAAEGTMDSAFLDELEVAFESTDRFFYLDLPGFQVIYSVGNTEEIRMMLLANPESGEYVGYTMSQNHGSKECIEETLTSLSESDLVTEMSETQSVSDQSDPSFMGEMCTLTLEGEEYFVYMAAVQKEGATLVVTLFEENEDPYFRESVLNATDEFVVSDSYVPPSESWIPFHAGS